MKHLRNVFLFFLFAPPFFILPTQVNAADFMNGKTVYLSDDKVINGSLVATGQTIRIEGEVDGDLFCLGQDITITGIIQGDILCAGQNITVASDVSGDIRAAGQTIDVSGYVGGNMTTVGQSVTLEKDSTVQGELMSWSEKLYIGGVVGSDVNGGGQTVTVDGNVGRNLSLTTQSLIVAKSASISGNVSYTSDETATIDKGASIAGSVTRVEPKEDSVVKSTSKTTKPPSVGRSWNGGLYVIMTLLVGGFLILFGKQPLENSLTNAENKQLTLFLYGLAAIFIMPIVMVLFAVTIIGIPVSLLLAFLFILSYFVGRSIIAIVLGRAVAARFAPSQKKSLGWSLVLGVLVSWILFSIPVIGGILSFITTVFGFGFVAERIVWRFRKK